jgi:hypothetical protein
LKITEFPAVFFSPQKQKLQAIQYFQARVQVYIHRNQRHKKKEINKQNRQMLKVDTTSSTGKLSESMLLKIHLEGLTTSLIDSYLKWNRVAVAIQLTFHSLL